MKHDMEWVKEILPGISLTLAYICGIVVFRWRDVWTMFYQGRLNELGDFFAGIFTPVALGWLIYGYLLQTRELRLQRRELGLQNTELGLQREELTRTRETLSQQTAVLQGQAEIERDKSRPNLIVKVIENTPDGWNLVFRNVGGPAYDVAITKLGDEQGSTTATGLSSPDFLDRGEEIPFSLPHSTGPPIIYYSLSAEFTSEREERLHQRWIITCRHIAIPSIKARTKRPELLKT